MDLVLICCSTNVFSVLTTWFSTRTENDDSDSNQNKQFDVDVEKDKYFNGRVIFDSAR